MEFIKTHYETLGETVYSATHKSGLRVILINLLSASSGVFRLTLRL